MAKAEIIRSEAQKHLLDLNTSQHLKRALLRKTVKTRIPSLKPGEPCAFWRWAKKGLKKQESWVIARFLAWDPTSPSKLAWVRTGNTTTLIATGQLRAATGFEEWQPSEQDIKLLKHASASFTQQMMQDGMLDQKRPATRTWLHLSSQLALQFLQHRPKTRRQRRAHRRQQHPDCISKAHGRKTLFRTYTRTMKAP